MYYIVKSIGGHLFYVNEKHSLCSNVADALEFDTELQAKTFYEEHLVDQDIDYAIINAELFANSFLIGMSKHYDGQQYYLKDFDANNLRLTSWTNIKSEAAIFLPDQKKLFDHVKLYYPEAEAIWKTKILF